MTQRPLSKSFIDCLDYYMLIQYIFPLIFALSAASCAKSSDIKEIINQINASSQSDNLGQLQFTPLIDIALNTPKIFSQLDFCSSAILSAFSASNICTYPLYDFVLAEYDLNIFEFNPEDPHYWHALINFPFRDFARQNPDQAEIIIKKIVIPNHPFLSQVHYRFQIDDFNSQFIPDIDIFLEKTAKIIFAQQFSQIIALKNSSASKILLKALLYKVKELSRFAPEFKYHHAFLTSVPIHYYKTTYFFSHECFSDIESYIARIASTLYRAISDVSQEEARKILAGILPSHYSTITPTSYENTIQEFESSLQQPIDNNPYFWDPQLLSSNIFAFLALYESNIEMNISHPHMSILRIISQDSPLTHLFRHYIAQAYLQPLNLSTEQQLLFWHSLILSSISEFSSNFPYYARLILQEISVSLDDIHTHFFYGRLDDEFSPYDHFRLVARWGHSATVELLMLSRADISADDFSNALFAAAEGGHTQTVQMLINSPYNISNDDAGLALCNAAQSGHTDTVELLIKFPDILADDIGLAYRIAAKCGHTTTFNVLQSCSVISADNAGLALRSASQGCHTAIIELLQSRLDISDDHVGMAFRSSAENGNLAIVELLQNRRDISADQAGWALQGAARGGHATIVELLQRSFNISGDHAGLALREAVQGGHIAIVQLIQSHFNINISADHAGFALYKAAQCGHTAIFELLQSQSYISAAYAGLALINATEGGHIDIVERLQCRTDIEADQVGLAFRRAVECGLEVIVELLQNCTKLTANDAALGLCKAAESGNIAIFELLQNRQDISADHAGWALCNAAQRGHAEIVDRLLGRLDISAKYAILALDNAYRNGHNEIVDALQAYVS